MKRFQSLPILLICMAVLAVSACTAAEPEQSQAATTESVVVENDAVSEDNAELEQDVLEDAAEVAVVQLYVGCGDAMQAYDLTLAAGEEATPERLVAGIAELTGWDLTLADEITTGKGGMTVVFANESSIFTGPPDTQKDAFFVFDEYQLVETILDSVKTTLQMNSIVPGLGDPDSVDIYFAAEGDVDIVTPAGIVVDMTTPYTGFENVTHISG